MKITKFFLDKATYKAIDDLGQEVRVEIDYWNNSFKLSNDSIELARTAEDMLKRKHKVNFVDKLLK